MTGWYMRFSVFTSPGERPVLGIGNEKSKIFFWDLQSIEEWSEEVTPEILEDLRNGPRNGPGPGRGRGRGRRSAAHRGTSNGRHGGRHRAGALSGTPARSLAENRESSILSGGTGANEDAESMILGTVPTLGLMNAESSSSPSRRRTASVTPATWSVDPPRSADTPMTTISGAAMDEDQGLPPLPASTANFAKFSPHDPWMKLKPHAERVAPKVNFAVRQMAWSRGGEWCVVVGDEGMICILGRP